MITDTDRLEWLITNFHPGFDDGSTHPEVFRALRFGTGVTLRREIDAEIEKQRQVDGLAYTQELSE